MWTTYEAAMDTTAWIRRPPLPISGAYTDVLPLGVREDGTIESWRVREQANLLITGDSGAAGTLLAGLTIEATRRRWRVRVCQPAFGELSGLNGWPGVEAVASTPAARRALIAATHNQLENRQAQLESGETDVSELVPVFLVLDRVPHRSGDESTRRSAARLREIAADGHAVDVHVAYADTTPPPERSLRDSFETLLWLGDRASLSALDEEDPAEDGAVALLPFRQPLPVAGGADDEALAGFRQHAPGTEHQGVR